MDQPLASWGYGFAPFQLGSAVISLILRLGAMMALIKAGFMSLCVVRVQGARSATIWASGRSRNPYFVVLWASLLFGSRF